MTISYEQNTKLLECYLANLHIPVIQGVRTYLNHRGFTDDTISAFRLGSTTSKRIAFPICDCLGNVLGFQTRTTHNNYEDGKKYVNTPNTEGFTKSHCLFGHDLARKITTPELYVVEGNFDVMRMHQMGHINTVGIMGSNMSDRQAYEITQMSRDVCLMFDGDKAGMDGMCNAYEKLLKHKARVTALVLEDGQDPDSYLQQAIPTPERHDMMDVYLHEKALKQNLETFDGRYKYILSIVGIFANHPDKDACIRRIEEVVNAV